LLTRYPHRCRRCRCESGTLITHSMGNFRRLRRRLHNHHHSHRRPRCQCTVVCWDVYRPALLGLITHASIPHHPALQLLTTLFTIHSSTSRRCTQCGIPDTAFTHPPRLRPPLLLTLARLHPWRPESRSQCPTIGSLLAAPAHGGSASTLGHPSGMPQPSASIKWLTACQLACERQG
jgi:hypothetical protein